MNLLKVNITKIISEENIHLNGSSGDSDSYTKVNIETECYGYTKQFITTFLTKEWEEIKNQGYYMA